MNAVEVFLVEAMGTAVIDTARTRTVCGERWLDNYLKTLDELSFKKVKRNPSSIGFRFGDGGRINSFETATIPAGIAGVKCQIITEIIKKDIPLLLSKASLKKAGACLDLKNDKALMFGQEIQLQLTSSGHYCVDIKSAKDFERKPYLLKAAMKFLWSMMRWTHQRKRRNWSNFTNNLGIVHLSDSRIC